VSRCERGVAAQPDFASWGEPAQLEASFGGDQKCGLRKVIFGSDFTELILI
jgi:hypothetical protein